MDPVRKTSPSYLRSTTVCVCTVGVPKAISLPILLWGHGTRAAAPGMGLGSPLIRPPLVRL